MSEVQAHGNKYESIIIYERTGLSKKKYDKLKKGGYTSSFDLCDGLFVDYDASVKTTSSNTICCSDLLKMMGHTGDYRLIVGCYEQVGNEKVFHTQYEFFIESQHYEMLWAGMKYDLIEDYVNKVKSVQRGEEGQRQYQLVAEYWKSEVQSDESMFVINPKVDSKKQRRVQCSVKLDEMLLSGIKYIKRDINITIPSSKRKFKK
jgi:hypothetical protein